MGYRNINVKLTNYVLDNIKKIKGDVKKIKTSTEDFLIKKIQVKSDGTAIKAHPLSFGYSGKDSIKGNIYYLETLEPHISFYKHELKDKIVYIENLNRQSDLRYLKDIPVKAVIVNKNFYRKIYIENYPIIYTPSILEKNSSIEISINFSNKKIKSRNFFVDVGLGGNYIIILFPFDSRFQTVNDLAFWGSFQLFLTLLRRFKNFSSEKLKIRFLAIDFKYSNYIELKKQLEHIDNVIAVYNLDNSGIGNEKLIIKTDRYIIDKYHFEKINEIFKGRKESLNYDISRDYVQLDLKKPVIWFNSQPNEYLYLLKKEFLNKNLYLNTSELIFEIITKSYEGVNINA